MDESNKTMFDVPFKITCCKQDDCNKPMSASIMSCYQGSFVSPPNDDIMNTLQTKASQEFDTNVVTGRPAVTWVDHYGVTGCGVIFFSDSFFIYLLFAN